MIAVEEAEEIMLVEAEEIVAEEAVAIVEVEAEEEEELIPMTTRET